MTKDWKKSLNTAYIEYYHIHGKNKETVMKDFIPAVVEELLKYD